MYRYLLSLSTLSMLVVTATATCSHEETNKASQEFKDCVDRKELQLIRMDRTREDKQTFICDKLEELSSDCHRALAKCRTREYVDDKVAIHINSISGNNIQPHFIVLLSFSLCPTYLLSTMVPCCWTKRNPWGQQIF